MVCACLEYWIRMKETPRRGGDRERDWRNYIPGQLSLVPVQGHYVLLSSLKSFWEHR